MLIDGHGSFSRQRTFRRWLSYSRCEVDICTTSLRPEAPSPTPTLSSDPIGHTLQPHSHALDPATPPPARSQQHSLHGTHAQTAHHPAPHTAGGKPAIFF